MYIDFALAGTQVALIVLKLIRLFDRSWWLVFLPTLIWCLGGLLLTAMSKGEDE